MLVLPLEISLLYTPPLFDHIDDSKRAVAFVECFYVKVDEISPSQLQLLPLSLSCTADHYYRRLQICFLFFPQLNCLALHWKTSACFSRSQTTYDCRYIPTQQISSMGWVSWSDLAPHWWKLKWAIDTCVRSLFESYGSSITAFTHTSSTF